VPRDAITEGAAASTKADRLHRYSGYKNFMRSCNRSSSGKTKVDDSWMNIAGYHRDVELIVLRSSMP
jgi:hypothetical protein